MTETMLLIPYILSGICILFCIIFTLRNYLHTRKIMKNLDAMLDRAINGTFTTDKIDETMYSALEFKLSHYLTACELSAQNVAAEKDKIKELISDISHQTKTPISNVLLYSELLGEQNLSAESQNYVHALNAQAQKLKFLINSLVKLSRLETGILTLAPSKQPIMPMLEKIKEQFAASSTTKGLSFTLNATEAEAVFDAKWTVEALCNLVDNAIKYTSHGGITIDVIPYELFCCIKISDTGMGIAEEEQPRIFSRFYRSSDVHTEDGIGIGLYLARKIISEESGYIKLTSSPGKGSQFAVYLPINLSKP